MVTKSAFERSKARLNYGFTVIANSENLTWKKTPHSNGDHPTRKIQPGFEFDYTLPVNKNFGVVVTGMQSNKYNEQHLSTTLFNAGGAGTGASGSTTPRFLLTSSTWNTGEGSGFVASEQT